MAYTTIDDPTIFFNSIIYTGDANSSTQRTVGFQPDWSWIKARNQAYDHRLQDSVRGGTKSLDSNTSDAEATFSTGQVFNSTGFTIGDAGLGNESSTNYVSWNWKESATAGFDICSWTGNGSAQNISHNLSKVPTMIIVKNRTDAGADWYCYNVHNGNTHSILLNTDGAKVGAYSDNWNNTTPTSSVFTVGSSNSTGGSSGDNMIAYVFTDIKGYSKFGSFATNGNAEGPFIYLGFKPAMVILKVVTSSGYNWVMFDNKRDTHNVGKTRLFPDVNNADATNTNTIDFLSNGFKYRTSGGSNASGKTTIYMAFAESPFVNSSGVPNNAK